MLKQVQHDKRKIWIPAFAGMTSKIRATSLAMTFGVFTQQRPAGVT
ncbi:hypothetical protein [Rickettsia endosymbiont of Orchestes rusci]